MKDLGTPVRPVRLAEVKYLSPYGTDRPREESCSTCATLRRSKNEKGKLVSAMPFPILVAEDDAIKGIIMLATRSIPELTYPRGHVLTLEFPSLRYPHPWWRGRGRNILTRASIMDSKAYRRALLTTKHAKRASCRLRMGTRRLVRRSAVKVKPTTPIPD